MPELDDNQEVTISDLLSLIRTHWDTLNRYLDDLTLEQLTVPTDAAGWTVKDHVMHIAVWERGIVGLLRHQVRHAAMGVDDETWEKDYDEINAVIFEQHRHMTWPEVRSALNAVHDELLAEIAKLEDADLMRPYRDFEDGSTADEPILGWIDGNTFLHYEEHMPWMDAIVKGR